MRGPSSLRSSASMVGPLRNIRRVAQERVQPFHGMRNRYVCSTCGKIFHVPQALGGHQKGHNKGKGALVLGPSLISPSRGFLQDGQPWFSYGSQRSLRQGIASGYLNASTSQPRYCSSPMEGSTLRNEVSQPTAMQSNTTRSPQKLRQYEHELHRFKGDLLPEASPKVTSTTAELLRQPVHIRNKGRGLVNSTNDLKNSVSSVGPLFNPVLEELVPLHNPQLAVMKESFTVCDSKSSWKCLFSLHEVNTKRRTTELLHVGETSSGNEVVNHRNALLTRTEPIIPINLRIVNNELVDDNTDLDLELHL